MTESRHSAPAPAGLPHQTAVPWPDRKLTNEVPQLVIIPFVRRPGLKRLKLLWFSLRLRTDEGDWIIPDRLIGCAYPKTDTSLRVLRDQGITLLVNLSEHGH